MLFLTPTTSPAPFPTLLLGSLLLACGGGENSSEGADPANESQTLIAHSVASHGSDDGMATLAVEKRVAFMSGHVEAGLALYRAGAPDQAAKHLLHPVSETHAAERSGIDGLGFTAEIFEAVSEALAEGREASEIEPMLRKAEENIDLLRKNAGGDPKAIIAYLMETVIEEYGIGVTDGLITDPGEYQDAYGFSVVAGKTALLLPSEGSASTIAAIQELIGLWPENGPLASSVPTVVADVVAHARKVTASLQAE